MPKQYSVHHTGQVIELWKALPRTVFQKSEETALPSASIHVFHKYLSSLHHVPGTVSVIMIMTGVTSVPTDLSRCKTVIPEIPIFLA